MWEHGPCDSHAREDWEVLEILKKMVEEGQMYLHRLRVGVEDEVGHREEVVL